MMVEFYGRYKKEKTKEELERLKEDEKLKELLGRDIDFEQGDEEYMYKPITFDCSKFNVKSFNDVDGEHTFVKTYTTDGYILKVNYQEFKHIYAAVNGLVQKIPSCNDFIIEDVVNK